MLRAALCTGAIVICAAACGGQYAQSPGAQCLAILSVQMMYPQNGATGIPDGNFDLYAGYPQNPSFFLGTPVLTAQNTATVQGSMFTPALGPPPNGATSSPGNQAFVSHIPPLNAATTYSASFPGGACAGASLGTFTTQ